MRFFFKRIATDAFRDVRSRKNAEVSTGGKDARVVVPVSGFDAQCVKPAGGHLHVRNAWHRP